MFRRSTPDPAALSREHRRIALLVAGGLLMEQFDSTVLSTALPAMAHSFGTSPVHLSGALTAYLLGLVLLLPSSGRIADRFGSRTIFRAAIALFTAGSVLCAVSQSLPFLVGARFVQGCGGALMVPVGRLVLMRSVRKDQLINAVFWTLMPATVGPMLGPPIGGFLTTALSWRWIFIINVPIGLAGLVAAGLIPQMRERAATRFDGLGVVLSAIALVGLVFGLEQVRGGPSGFLLAVPTLLTGAVAAGLYIRHARRIASPVLDLSLLGVETFRLSVLSGTASRIAIGGMPFLLPSMLQIGFGLSAAQSGAITFSTTLGSIVVRFLSASILRRLGYRSTLLLNGASACVLTVCCAGFRPGWPLALLFPVLFVTGFTQSLQFTALNTIAYADVPSERMGAATGLYSTVQQLGLTLGISIAAVVASLSASLSGHPSAGLADFAIGLVAIGLCSLFAIPACWRLPRSAGAELSGHRSNG